MKIKQYIRKYEIEKNNFNHSLFVEDIGMAYVLENPPTFKVINIIKKNEFVCDIYISVNYDNIYNFLKEELKKNKLNYNIYSNQNNIFWFIKKEAKKDDKKYGLYLKNRKVQGGQYEK